MKELYSIPFQRLKTYLESTEIRILGNLTPFFSVRFYEIDAEITPDKILINSYPNTKPDNENLIKRSANDFSEALIIFCKYIESENEEEKFKIAYELLESVESCINYHQGVIWEYLPDEKSYDDLDDYMAHGFTYLIVRKDEGHCLIIHGGYSD